METTEDSPEPEIPEIDAEHEASSEGANSQGNSNIFHDFSPSPELYERPPPYDWEDDDPRPPYPDDTEVETSGSYVDAQGIQQFHDMLAESGPSGRSLVDQLLRPRTSASLLRQAHEQPSDDGEHTAEEDVDEDEDYYDPNDYDEDAREFGDDDAVLMVEEMGPHMLPPPVMGAPPDNPIGSQVHPLFNSWWAIGQREMGAGPSDADLTNPPPGYMPLFPGYSSESSDGQGSPMSTSSLGANGDDVLMGGARSSENHDDEEPLIGSADGLGGSHNDDLMGQVVFSESHDHDGSPIESDVSSDEIQDDEERPTQAHPVGAQGEQEMSFHPFPLIGHSPTSLSSSFEDFNRSFTDRLHISDLNRNLMTTYLSSVEPPDMPTFEPRANEGEEEMAVDLVDPTPQGTKRARSQSRSQSPEVKRTRFGRSESPEARRVLTFVGQSVRNRQTFNSRRRLHGHQRGIQMSDRFIARCQAVLDDPNAPAVKKEEAREQIARLVEEINEANDDVDRPLVGSDQTK
jgi:hypothetical protein